jgi:hypothetical protein
MQNSKIANGEMVGNSMRNISIPIDTTDLESLRDLMSRYGDSDSAFFGENSDGEPQLISVFYDRIVIVTYRDDGSEVRHIYHADGSRECVYTPFEV